MLASHHREKWYQVERIKFGENIENDRFIQTSFQHVAPHVSVSELMIVQTNEWVNERAVTNKSQRGTLWMYRACPRMSQLSAYRRILNGKLFNELEFMRCFCFVGCCLMKMYIRFLLYATAELLSTFSRPSVRRLEWFDFYTYQLDCLSRT